MATKRSPTIAAAAGLLLTLPVAQVSASPFFTDRVVNGGAEQGLMGWTSSGFGFEPYGVAGDVPTAEFAARGNLGSQLFTSRSQNNATLTQPVDLQDVSETIDQGRGQIALEALLSGAAGSARVTAQALDAGGVATGAPLVLGPPTAEQIPAQCRANVIVASGVRSIRLTASAESPVGQVDAIKLSFFPTPSPTVRASSGTGLRAAANSCELARFDQGPATPVPATPAPAPPMEQPQQEPRPSSSPQALATKLLLARTKWSMRLSSAASVKTVVQRRSSDGRWVASRRHKVSVKRATALSRRYPRLRSGVYRLSVTVTSGAKTKTRKTAARRFR